MTGFPASEAKVYEFGEPHWFKGYKGVSIPPQEMVDLWRIQERGARPMAELAAEGKLGPMFQNEKAIQHFKDREKYFGQWFTKDKNDFDFYKTDREFIDPEIIQLRVPKNKLQEFQNYDKSLSRASDREFVIPFEQQELYRASNTPGARLSTGLGKQAGKYLTQTPLRFVKDIQDAGRGPNVSYLFSEQADIARKLQQADLLGKDVNTSLLGKYPNLGNTVVQRALKNFNTTYRAVDPNVNQMTLDEMMHLAQAGYHIDDPIQVAQYMNTHVPLKTIGYRAAPVSAGPGQDMLFTGKFKNAEEARKQLEMYGTHMSEVRPPMDFSTGSPANWFQKYYSEKPFIFGTSSEPVDSFRLLDKKWQPGSIAGRRENEYWPYIGERGDKLLEAVRTIDLRSQKKYGGEQYALGGAASPKDLNPATMQKYKQDLKLQENSIKAGYNKAQDRWYPHASVEGGNKTIGYGHKLTNAEVDKFNRGITSGQVEELLQSDILKHQAIAENMIDKKYGKGAFDKLPQAAQMIFVDYAYNGVLGQFPTFTDALVKRNKNLMLKEYERSSSGGKLTERNNWTRGIIEKNFQDGGPIELELTPEEIDWYISQGYEVEDLN